MVQKGLKALNHFQEPLEALRSSSLSLVDTARSSVWICTWEWQNLHLRMTMADGRPNRAPGATGYSSYFHHQRGLPAYIFLPLLQLSEIKLSTVFPSCGFFPPAKKSTLPSFPFIWGNFQQRLEECDRNLEKCEFGYKSHVIQQMKLYIVWE